MTISLSTLRSAALDTRTAVANTITEAKILGVRTAFLCHSHQDALLAKGLARLLQNAGWRVYIDWTDATMPEKPNRETTRRIQQKIVDLDYFLFLATANSVASRWCPWEIGYADGKKQPDRILMVPTTDGVTTHGNEYLQLYRRVDVSNRNQLAVWQPGENQNGILVESL